MNILSFFSNLICKPRRCKQLTPKHLVKLDVELDALFEGDSPLEEYLRKREQL